ncbi:MAG: ATP-binding protein, partial [Acidimicrobiales bacterium]
MHDRHLLPLRERRHELDQLKSAATAAAGGRPQLVVLSGLRRVGKTFLLQHLEQEIRTSSPVVYFEATQAGEAAELRRFRQALDRALGASEAPPYPAFSSWEQALQFCAYLARERPLTVIIDEVTYLMSSTPGFASTVQAVWDSISGTSGPAMVLVLAGSAVGMVGDALDYRGALYQRPTLVLRLDPFTAPQAHRYLGEPDPTVAVEAFAACGGYPLHLDGWDTDQKAADNLLRLAGTPGGLLLEDGAALVNGLPDSARRVLIAIGQGRARRSEIVNDVGMRVDRPIEAVQRARLVHGEVPLGAPQKTRPLYRIADPFLRFWLRLLANHVQRIEAGQGAAVLEHVTGEWQNHLGVVFETMAREHAVR